MIPGWSSIPVNSGASFRGHMASGVSMATTGKTCFCVPSVLVNLHSALLSRGKGCRQ
jgi:hypothetical protein